MQDFKDELVAFSKAAVTRAERVTSEEAAKQFLILPFFQFLGYDPLDPDEVVPEAQASFSDKFKNKVDYAICIDRVPVIGVECKKTGELATADKGEIRGYFNAVPSIKLGILTDGLVYRTLFGHRLRKHDGRKSVRQVRSRQRCTGATQRSGGRRALETPKGHL